MPGLCGGCTREWSGMAECHCSYCHEHFSTIRNFDKHIDKNGCIDPNILTTLVTQGRASGVVWVEEGEWNPAVLRKGKDK